MTTPPTPTDVLREEAEKVRTARFGLSVADCIEHALRLFALADRLDEAATPNQSERQVFSDKNWTGDQPRAQGSGVSEGQAGECRAVNRSSQAPLADPVPPREGLEAAARAALSTLRSDVPGWRDRAIAILDTALSQHTTPEEEEDG